MGEDVGSVLFIGAKAVGVMLGAADEFVKFVGDAVGVKVTFAEEGAAEVGTVVSAWLSAVSAVSTLMVMALLICMVVALALLLLLYCMIPNMHCAEVASQQKEIANKAEFRLDSSFCVPLDRGKNGSDKLTKIHKFPATQAVVRRVLYSAKLS